MNVVWTRKLRAAFSWGCPRLKKSPPSVGPAGIGLALTMSPLCRWPALAATTRIPLFHKTLWKESIPRREAQQKIGSASPHPPKAPKVCWCGPVTNSSALRRAARLHQQLYSTADSTLLQRSPTIWMPTEGLRLNGQLVGPKGGTPPRAFSRRFKVRGANGYRYWRSWAAITGSMLS